MPQCHITKSEHAEDELVPYHAIRNGVVRLIKAERPDFNEQSKISLKELNRFRAAYVRLMLEAESGEISILEEEVIKSLHNQETVASNLLESFESKLTFGDWLSDRLSNFVGGWYFIIAFGLFLVAWTGINSLILGSKSPDPYPFTFLNVILSCLAAVQAPLIMMSQNRMEKKDRSRSESDYRINLKAELEIRHLHEKIDHLMKHHAERLFEIQEIQIELLGEMVAKGKGGGDMKAEEEALAKLHAHAQEHLKPQEG